MKQVRLFSFAWGTWLLLAGALLLSAAGCTESTSVDASSGDPKDTGADPKDTGADPKDTGADPEDTGTDPEDTGADPEDTGTDPEDTGADPEDTGPEDTGPEDTGTEPEDTGPEDTGPDPLAENGVACFADSECDSGFCADGVCCESSCDGDCAVCNAAGFEGTCTPHIAGVVCRSAVGECDLAEVCDGESFACPEDAFDDGALCGEASDCVTGGVCTAADTCELAFADPGTECGGAPVGVCSAQSTCDGAGTCSPNFLGAETECRAAANECDVAEVCAGDSPDCPTDLFAEAGEPCGDGTFHSACNLPDTCDGNGFCDANLQPTSVVCREAVDDCDAPEYCDGLGFCPADEVLPANTECRAAAGDCDIAAVCDGSSVVCPANDFVAAGADCGGLPNGDCDAQNTCDGAGGCTENYLGAET
ncbi:MAG: hypothetical protein GX146_05680, partial [Myxococcales bacterium]|nr:hypothetical protein [Myxococcales bacterium]